MFKIEPVLEKLADISRSVGIRVPNIELPKIVFIGEQGSGRTSLIEALVGKEFLPVGERCPTRRPIELQFFNKMKDAKKDVEIKVMETEPLAIEKDVNSWIEMRNFFTERIVETEQNLRLLEKPLRARIYSKEFTNNITMIDLPGFGGPNSDRIARLSHRYIRRKNDIIVVVHSVKKDVDFALDLSNSESLKIAKRVDPNGERTIIVLTKLDLLRDFEDDEKIEEVFKILSSGGEANQRTEFKSQGILSAVPSLKSQKFEDIFFLTHSKFRPISRKQGVEYLRKKIRMMIFKIRICGISSEYNERIQNLLEHAQDRLVLYDKKFHQFISSEEDMKKGEQKEYENMMKKLIATKMMRRILRTAKNVLGEIDGTWIEEQKEDENMIYSDLAVIVHEDEKERSRELMRHNSEFGVDLTKIFFENSFCVQIPTFIL